MEYYVYTYVRLDTGNVFYVGKGKGERAYSMKSRNPYFLNIVKSIPHQVSITKMNMTEEEAFEEETKLIAQYKEQGIELANMTDGGEGISGYKHTEEYKEYVSNLYKGRKIENHWDGGFNGPHTQATKDLISNKLKDKPFSGERWSKGRNKPCSAEHRAKISATMTGVPQTWKYKPVICVETGVVYESVGAASLATGIARTTISTRLKTGKPTSIKNGFHFKFVEKKVDDTLLPLPINEVRPIVYLIAGQSGAGKTWVANQLKDKFTGVYSNDRDGHEKSVAAMLDDLSGTYIYETPVYVSTFINKNQHQLDIRLVVILEEEEVVKARLAARSGSQLAAISRRNVRFKNMVTKYNAVFSGTSQDCLSYLQSV